MVEEYRKMRERDSSGIARTSWRITVRQLESLIRWVVVSFTRGNIF